MLATGQPLLVSSAQALKRDQVIGESVDFRRSGRSMGNQNESSELDSGHKGGCHLGDDGGTGLDNSFDKRKSDSVPPE